MRERRSMPVAIPVAIGCRCEESRGILRLSGARDSGLIIRFRSVSRPSPGARALAAVAGRRSAGAGGSDVSAIGRRVPPDRGRRQLARLFESAFWSRPEFLIFAANLVCARVKVRGEAMARGRSGRRRATDGIIGARARAR